MIDALIHVHDVNLHDEDFNPLPSGPIRKTGDEALIYARLDELPTNSNLEVLAKAAYIGRGTADRVYAALEGDALATYKRLYNTEPYTVTDPETNEETTITPPFKFGMLAEGPSMIPQSVSRRQGKQQLVLSGLYQQFLDYVDAIEDPTDKMLAEIWMHDANPWDRNSPNLTRLGAGLGLTETDIDNLFIEAAAL